MDGWEVVLPSSSSRAKGKRRAKARLRGKGASLYNKESPGEAVEGFVNLVDMEHDGDGDGWAAYPEVYEPRVEEDDRREGEGGMIDPELVDLEFEPPTVGGETSWIDPALMDQGDPLEPMPMGYIDHRADMEVDREEVGAEALQQMHWDSD